MSDRTCSFCTKIFVYPYLLDRHLNSKRGCPMSVFERDSPMYARDLDKCNKMQLTATNYNEIQLSASECNQLQLPCRIQEENKLNSTDEEYYIKSEDKWLCLLCNKNFTRRSTVLNHIFKIKCKKINSSIANKIHDKFIQLKHVNIVKNKLSMYTDINNPLSIIKSKDNNLIKDNSNTIELEPLDIVNEIIPEGKKKVKIIRKSQQTNINNGTINNNNTINNTNIVLVNPLGLETLTHTTPDLYKKILKGGEHNIVRFLLEAIYSRQENQNFFKDNKNQPHIAYIDDSYNIKYMHESQLRDYILRNIPSKIEQLIYIHQKNMKPEHVVKYLTHSINIEKNFIDLDNKSNPNYKNLIDVGNTVNTVIRTHGVKDNILNSQDLFITNQNDVTEMIDNQKQLNINSHNEFNYKSKSTAKATSKVIEAPETEDEVKEVKKPIPANGELNEEELLELTGYDLTVKNKKKTITKVSSTEKKEEVVTKSLYDLKNDLSIQYDKTFSSNINTL